MLTAFYLSEISEFTCTVYHVVHVDVVICFVVYYIFLQSANVLISQTENDTHIIWKKKTRQIILVHLPRSTGNLDRKFR